jgi:hypothetical protein
VIATVTTNIHVYISLITSRNGYELSQVLKMPRVLCPQILLARGAARDARDAEGLLLPWDMGRVN